MELYERLSRSGRPIASPAPRDPFAEVKNRIHLSLVGELGPQLFDVSDSSETQERVTTEIRAQLQQEPLSHEDRERLVREIADDVLGYGPLERLLADPTVSEIMVNGPDDIWVEREGRLSQTA